MGEIDGEKEKRKGREGERGRVGAIEGEREEGGES